MQLTQTLKEIIVHVPHTPPMYLFTGAIGGALLLRFLWPSLLAILIGALLGVGSASFASLGINER